uniref:Probable proton-coupled zinc antiporter SLC30A3 n=1 Tax=Cairina moschata TaxID=8855 RepID=A0A8C3BRW3_CAIMO
MEPPAPSGSESARLVSPRGGRADGSLRLKRLFAGPRDAPAPLRPGEGGQDAAPEPGGAPQCLCSPAPPGSGLGPERLQARRQLSIACTVCCVFMVGEVIGGYLAHSLAIMTDAAHLLTDVGSMSVSLFSLWVSARPPTKTMSFGWHRSETLGALASVLSIWVVTGALVYLAAARIISNDYEIEARAMLATSASAVGVNLVMAYILHQAPAIHSHGAGGYEQLEGAGGCLPGHAPLPGSTSVRAAFVHVVGDLLQSIGVLVAATIIYFKVRGPRVGWAPVLHRALGGTGPPGVPAQLAGASCPQLHAAPALCSPSARSQTPSVPSSSRSSSLAPPSLSSETSSECSWKVRGGQGRGCRGCSGSTEQPTPQQPLLPTQPPPSIPGPSKPPPRPFSATWGAAASPQKHCAAAWSQTGGVPTPSCPPGPRTPDPSWGIGLGPAPP